MARSKGGNIKIEWYGFEDYLKKLEKAGADLEAVVEKAVKRSAIPIKSDIYGFMEAHSPGGSKASPWATGETIESWNEGIVKWKDGVLSYEFGFNIKKGGLPVIFLNYGGFYNEPYLFLEKALDRNVDKIKKAQEEVLKAILKELE